MTAGAPMGPRGAEDMRYWPVSTNASSLFGLRSGVDSVAGFIQPTFNVGATPAARGNAPHSNYFYGSVQQAARTDRWSGLMLEAEGGGESFLQDAFSMIGNLVVEQIGLGPLIRPFGVFRPTSDFSVVVEGVYFQRSGSSGEVRVHIFVQSSPALPDDQENIVPGSLIPDAAATSTLLTGASSGGLSSPPEAFLEVPLTAPLQGAKHSSFLVRFPDMGFIREPLFPAALQPGDVLNIVSGQGGHFAIAWSEFAN